MFKKQILAGFIFVLLHGVVNAATYDESKTNYSANTSGNPDAVAHAKALVATTEYGGATAYASDSTVIGDPRSEAGYRATVIGANNKGAGEGATSTGYSANAHGVVSSAYGVNSNAIGDGSVAIGAENQAAGNRSVNIGRGGQSTAAGATGIGSANKASGVNSVAVGSVSEATGTQSVAMGTSAQSNGNRSLAIGPSATANNGASVAVGAFAEATHRNSVALGGQSRTEEATKVSWDQVGSVIYGDFAGSEPVGVVSVGNESMKRQIKNVGAGEISETSTDAINGSQLYSVAKTASQAYDDAAENRISIILLEGRVGDNEANIAANKQTIAKVNSKAESNAKAISNTNNQVNANSAAIIQNRVNIAVNKSEINRAHARIDTLQSTVSANAERINALDDKIRHADKKLRAGIAGVTAIANLPQAYQPGKSQIAVAVGAYRGETGYALGWSRNSDNAKHTFKLSVSGNSRSDFGAGAGYGYNY